MLLPLDKFNTGDSIGHSTKENSLTQPANDLHLPGAVLRDREATCLGRTLLVTFCWGMELLLCIRRLCILGLFFPVSPLLL